MTTFESPNGQSAPEIAGLPAAPASQPAPATPQEQAPEQKPAPKPTRILLIRHGVNDFVKQGLLAGRTPNVSLNDEGKAQALALAERLVAERLAADRTAYEAHANEAHGGASPAADYIAAIYTSPLERCRETAAPVAERLGLELRPLEGVKETDCGDWTGQALKELSKLEVWAQVQMNPSGFRFPNGESMLEIQARMVAALDALQKQHAGQTIAVFSHSDPIKLAVAFFVGMPLDLFQRLDVSPASITELEFSPLRVRLVRLNDHAHVPPPPPAPREAELSAAAEESPAAKGALEEQVIKGPGAAGPEPEALQVADEGKLQATGG